MTKSATGAGNIRKRADGTWEARFTYHDPLTGKTKRKSVYGHTQAEVRKKLTEKTAEVDKTGSAFEPSKMTVGQWLNMWLDDFAPDIKYSTRVSYKASIKNHLIPGLGDIKLAELKPIHIQHFYNSLAKTESQSPRHAQQSTTLSPKTIRNYHGILCKALNVAVEQEMILRNPADHVKLPKAVKPAIRPLNDEDVDNFLNAIEGDEYERLLKVILYTGLRESEALGLTWDCVNFDTNELCIKQQLQKRKISDGGYKEVETKNSKPRKFKVSATVMRLLEQEKLHQMECRLAAGPLWQGWQSLKEQKTALCFLKPDGVHVSVSVVYAHFKKAAKKIGLPEARVHDLRHTFAVLSLQNGDETIVVQKHLGHATAAFTLDVYGHVSERMEEESADRMESYAAEREASRAKRKKAKEA